MSTPAVPGWYEHPPGTGALRWWDGAHWQSAPDTIEQPDLPAGTTTDTWAIWTMALLPLLGPLSTVLLRTPELLREQVAQLQRQTQDYGAGQVHVVLPTAGLGPATLISQAIGLAFIAVQVLLAVSDRRTLAGRGVVRPFHWAWAFLQPTYVIGRAVVVRRRTGRGLAPLWVWIGAEVVSFAIVAVLVAGAFAASAGG